MQEQKNRLEIITGEKVSIVDDYTLKVHVKELDEVDIFQLNDYRQKYSCELKLKRSGTGITILVTLFE